MSDETSPTLEYIRRGCEGGTVVPPVQERIAVICVFALQLGMLAFQWMKLSRFYPDVAPYMPHIGDPKKTNLVQFTFDWGVIALPFLAQFIFVPGIVWWANKRLRGWVCPAAMLAVIVLGIACWYGAARGLGAAIAYFD